MFRESKLYMKSNKHIHDFSVPENYFNTLEERIMQNISMENVPKETGMQVPENYFEQLESRILDNCTNSKVRKKPKLVKLNTWWHVAAAACAIGFGLWLVPEKPEVNATTNTIVNSDYTIDYYIEDVIYDMPDSSLLNLMDNADIDVSFSDKINRKEVEEYLMENLDFSTLLSYE